MIEEEMMGIRLISISVAPVAVDMVGSTVGDKVVGSSVGTAEGYTLSADAMVVVA